MEHLHPTLEKSQFSSLIDALSRKVKSSREAIDEYITLGTLFRMEGQAKKAFKLHFNLLSHPKAKGKTLTRIQTELGLDALEAKIENFGLEYFEQSLGWRKRNIPSLLGMARAYEQLGKKDKQLEVLERLRKLNVDVDDALIQIYMEKSHAAQNQKNLSGAIEWAEKSSRIRPDASEVQYRLISLRVLNSNYKKALSMIYDFLKRWPEEPQIFFLLEDLFFKQGNYPEMENQLKDWIKSDLVSSELFFCLGKHLHKKHKLEEAKECLRRSLETNPQNAKSLSKLIQWANSMDDLGELKKWARSWD